jgi:xylan 1,4-beta-xylosidase
MLFHVGKIFYLIYYLKTKIMKKIIAILLILPLSFLVNAQHQTNVNKKGEGYYLNPIFSGDYPDPSILRDGSDYYIVHSSFEYYPGLLIWHSKDLINWTPVTHALHKYVGSVWAPDLVKHKDKYYIYFPANDNNYVVWANSINGPWSDPIDLKIGFIDPGHVVDSDGKRYLYFSSGSYVPLSDDGLSITGKDKHSYSGWPIPRDWVIECFCLEGPKIMKRGDYYYLTVAEGGTSGPPTSHMVISARSKSPLGPWENSPYNPIDRTKSSAERWCSKGHSTLIDDAAGNWWMVFHAYEKEYYNMGRQTLLQPIEWTADGWFKKPDKIQTDMPIKKPAGKPIEKKFTLSDDFSGKQLKSQWEFFSKYDSNRFQLVNNSLVLNAQGNSVSESVPLLCIPSDHSYSAQVELEFEGNAIGGLVLFYNNTAYSGIAANSKDILGIMRGWQFTTEKDVVKNRVFLRIENRKHIVNMYYSKDGATWNKIETSLEVSSLHHNALGGFLSLRIGLCSMGEGKVRFKNFKYESIK